MPFQEFDYRERQAHAVLWLAVPGSFDRYGQPMLAAPVQIQVRWNDVRKQVRDAKGNIIEVTAEVVLGQDVSVNSLMYHGNISDWMGTGSALPEDALVQVIGFDKTSDLKGRVHRRTCSCMRYRNKLPQGYG